MVPYKTYKLGVDQNSKTATLKRSNILLINKHYVRIPKGHSKKGQSRETGNTGYTRRRKTKQKHNTICVGHHNTQTNTNNGNKTRVLLQTTGGKYELFITLYFVL